MKPGLHQRPAGLDAARDSGIVELAIRSQGHHGALGLGSVQVLQGRLQLTQIFGTHEPAPGG